MTVALRSISSSTTSWNAPLRLPGKTKKDEGPKEFKAPPMNPALVPLVDILEEKASAMPLVISISSPGSMLHVDAAMSRHEERGERKAKHAAPTRWWNYVRVELNALEPSQTTTPPAAAVAVCVCVLYEQQQLCYYVIIFTENLFERFTFYTISPTIEWICQTFRKNCQSHLGLPVPFQGNLLTI